MLIGLFVVVLSLQAPAPKPPRRRTSTDSSASPLLREKREAAELACAYCLNNGAACDHPTFNLGLRTFCVPMALHEINRAKLVERMVQNGQKSGVILLQGGDQQHRYDTDHEPVFRQESYFQYAFGVSDAGCYGAISLPDARATLFVPKLGEDYEVFCGAYPPPSDFLERYGVEEVRYVEELPAWLAEQLGTDQALHLLCGLNSDSGNFAVPASFAGDERFEAQRDVASLFVAAAESRVTKSQAEVEVMRYVNWVSSMAHVEVMRAARPGMMEYQLESLFQHHTYTHGGCRHQAYTCICACGPNPAILHYGHAGRPNARQIADGDMALLDMGAEYHCYAADITCSFPITAAGHAASSRPPPPSESSAPLARPPAAAGFFTPNQRVTYEAVLDAQLAVIGALKPGVSWADMHRLAERTILRALVAAGVLRLPEGEEEKSDLEATLDEMLDADLGAIFMPHGLGHLIGLDTHDGACAAQRSAARHTHPHPHTRCAFRCGMLSYTRARSSLQSQWAATSRAGTRPSARRAPA